MRWAWLAMTLSVAASLSTQPARADDAGFAWSGPECLTREPLFRARLDKLLDAEDRARLSGYVRVGRDGAWLVTELAIELDGERLGTRRFRTSTCEKVAETAAVATSMAVYAAAEEAPREGVAAKAGDPNAWLLKPDPVPDFTPTKRRRIPPPRPSLAPRLGLLATADIAVLPRPVLGAALALEVGLHERWSLSVVGGLTGEQERDVAAGQVARLRMYSAAARGCVAPVSGAAYRIDACSGLRFVRVTGRGEGFDIEHAAALDWLAPLLGLDVTLRAPRFVEWRLEVEGSFPLSRRRFLVDAEEVSRAGVVTLGLRLGPVLRFR